jgi:hypothetical protein
MRSRSKPIRREKSRPAWHVGFLAMLPAICLHARISFRRLDPEAREEAVQNCIANATVAYVRLYELGKIDLAYPSALARYAVAQTKDARVVGGHLNIKDVLSVHCQVNKGVIVERLDRFDEDAEEWREIVIEDRRAGPAEIAATRLDFAAWLRSLPAKLRKIAKVLATGETTTTVAKKFGVSAGRISQIRKELYLMWNRFVGEEPDPAAV